MKTFSPEPAWKTAMREHDRKYAAEYPARAEAETELHTYFLRVAASDGERSHRTEVGGDRDHA